MRFLRITLYSLLGLIAVLAIALVVVLTIDLGRFKPNVETLVSDLTGRKLEIRGAFEPSLGKQIHLLAEDAHFAATEWSESPDLVSARRIEITVDTWSLISGPVMIESVALDGLQIHLQKNESGDNNWAFWAAGEAEETVEVDEDKSRPSLPLLIDNANITDLLLTFDSPGRPQPFKLTATELTEVILGTDDIQIALDGVLNETAVGLNATVGSAQNLLDYSNLSFELDASLGEIMIRGDGKIDDLLAPSRPEMHLRITGPGADYMMQVLHREPFTSGPMSFEASMKADGEQTVVEVGGVFGEFDLLANGRFVNLQEMHNIDLTLEADGPDIGTIIRLAGGEYSEKDPFELKANIHRSGSVLAVEGIILDVDESRFHISGRFNDFPNVAGAGARLNISGPDFGRFNRLFGMPGRLGGPFSMVATLKPTGDDRAAIEIDATTQDVQLRADADIGGAPVFVGSRVNVSLKGKDVSVIANAFGFEDAPQEKFEFNGSVVRTDAGVSLNDVKAIIGDDNIAVDGIIGNEPLKDGTDLHFDISGTDIDDALRTFGVKADRLPKGPFRAVGHVQRTKEHFILQNVRASIGPGQEYLFSADGVITDLSGSEGSKLDVGLRGNSLAALADLAGIPEIPDVSYNLSATVERRPKSFRIRNGIAELGSSKLTIDGRVGEQPLIRDTDLRLQFTVPDLGYSLDKFGIEVQHVPKGKVELSGRLYNKSGRLSLDDFTVAFAGMNAKIDGKLGELPSLDGTDFDLRISGDDFSRLLPDDEAFGEMAKRYNLKTNVRVRSERIELNGIKGSLGNVNLGGKLAIGMAPFFGVGNFDLNADSPDLFQLIPKLDDVSVAAVEVAPMRFSGSGEWQKNFWEFDDVMLNLGEGSIQLSGSVDGPPDFDRTDLEFDWHISNLNKLSILAGRKLPDHSAHIRAKITGTSDEMTMDEFVGRIGDSDINGSFSMRDGDVPEVTIAFTSKHLNLAPYLPPLDKDTADEPPPADGRLIPDTKLPTELLKKFDATVDVDIDELIGRVLIFRDVAIDGSVKSGKLSIHRITATGRRDGSLTAKIALTPNDEGGAKLAVSAEGSKLILGFQARGADDIHQLPTYGLKADLTANGETIRDLAASLDGYLRVVGSEGRIAAGSFSLITGDLFDQIVSTVNPFSKSDPFTNVTCSAILVQFDDGQATGNPVIVQLTDKLLMYANADINLKDERIKADFNTVPQRGLGLSLSKLVTPYVQLTGTLANPSLSLDPESTLIEGGAAVATVGLSILAKSFKERFFSTKDPCGDAVRAADAKVAEKAAQQ